MLTWGAAANALDASRPTEAIELMPMETTSAVAKCANLRMGCDPLRIKTRRRLGSYAESLARHAGRRGFESIDRPSSERPERALIQRPQSGSVRYAF